jgi:cell division protein FtsB
MGQPRNPPALGAVMFFGIVFMLGTYFTFASVQGDYGLFRRIQIEAEADVLRADVERLTAEVADLRNKTRRLSDEFLDIDLLDQQARELLGLVRGDEVIIR